MFGFACVPLFLPCSEGRVSCCPAAECTAECVCLLPKQWPLSCCWEGGGGGYSEDYFSRLTFSLNAAPLSFLPLVLATTTLALKPRGGLVCISFPCFSCRRVFFFPLFFLTSQACPTKTASPFFVSGAVQAGFGSRHLFPALCH